MNLFERVKAILLSPKSEWPVIEREPADTVGLFKNYVAILAAIPAAANFIGLSIIGYDSIQIPVVTGLIYALVSYVLSFVVVYIVALVVDALAPTFGGERSFDNALKVTVYSYTPGWLAGIFYLIPGLGILALLGLYGLYLLWTGLPPLMKSPPEKTLAYAAAVVVCAIIVTVIIGMIHGLLIIFPPAG